MIINIILWVLVVYIFLSLLFLPIQYRLLLASKKEKTLGEESLQSSPFFFLANVLAAFMYQTSHRKK